MTLGRGMGIPNPMRYYRWQKYCSQQRCASKLACGHCGDNGHSDEASSVPERIWRQEMPHLPRQEVNTGT
jgi:hypothetical protein